jgi:ribosomal protein S18 acetylase RimI-like enzyme
MAATVRRLAADEDAILERLARDEADFDVDGRSEAKEPLARDAARAFLGDANVLFWVAEQDGDVVGFLSCQLVRKRAEPPELLLYEIGVRAAHRRRGVGRALVAAMDDWMRAHDVHEVWVLADNDDAISFYRACGFSIPDGQATYLTRNHPLAGGV